MPEALANDNWFGYPTELLYTHKVRWIEAAAASPVWTSVINYYLEADRGNLIEEHLHRPEHRTAIRGNVSSFSIPWEEVLAALAPETRQNASWEKLPHPPHVLQAIVKVNVKGMLYNEAIEWVAGGTHPTMGRQCTLASPHRHANIQCVPRICRQRRQKQQ